MLIRDMGFSARLVSTSWPLFETYCRIVSFWVLKLIVFTFPNNRSNSNCLRSLYSSYSSFQNVWSVLTICLPKKVSLKILLWTNFNWEKIKAGLNDGHRQVQRKWRTLNVKYELQISWNRNVTYKKYKHRKSVKLWGLTDPVTKGRYRADRATKKTKQMLKR